MDDVELADLVAVVIDHVADLVAVIDQHNVIRWANLRSEDVLGTSLDVWRGRSVIELIHPDDLPLGLELLVSAKASGRGIKEPVLFRLRGADDWVPLEVIASNVELPDGELVTVFSARPTAPRRDGAAIVSEAGERLSRMFEDAAIGMAQVGLDGRLLRVNGSFAASLGSTKEQLVGTHLPDLVHPIDHERLVELFAKVVAGSPRVGRLSAQLNGADGQVVHAELTLSLVDDRLGSPMYTALQILDVTALKTAEAELLHRSTHDPLTGLVNRGQLFHLLDQALSRAARRDEQVAVLFLDLDGFKVVNDTLGHAAGDELLCVVAERLTAAVRRGDVVARLGGDEFVVMCEQFSASSEVNDLADRLIEALREPFVIDAGVAHIGASVGVAIETAMVVSADLLVRHADAALYEAKRLGRGRASRYTPAAVDQPPSSAQPAP
jgi:diguanylate cyclase (GGDEF)-like protein/PAS domain S-box-containing protein